MKASLLSLLAISTAVSAWLPHERNFFGEQPNSVARNLAAGKGRSVKRYLSTFNKIRGVNLGSLFIVEPWMAGQAWEDMGCGDSKSEFDCMVKLGQEAGNTAFANHWDTWITEADLDSMQDYGINTVRVPVGYWFVEELVYADSEHFPQGGLAKLDRLCDWAASRDMYVILDLHGAPGAQVADQPFTGQYAAEVGFYQTYQFERAYSFLQAMTDRIHDYSQYRTVGMLEVVNEPAKGHANLVSEYYATAYAKIRESETNKSIPADQQLTIQFMDSAWGAGNAKTVLDSSSGVAYDDHRYLKYSNIEQSKSSYLSTSCSDTFGKDANSPVIIGEWSLSVDSDQENDADWTIADPNNTAFYQQWWASQVQAYERGLGWVFWSWKAQLGNDWRWSYSQAVEASIIPKDPSNAAQLANC
ncbi:glycoside hydrolase family 5 protein [Pleomassaria siparia CBS 279.74]|uniref:glucan endo-1,6-beta-glucosidase n=1 Tax=Pleomassaria siparia CBS 279.74 TaxID=1314801 RepID=A0A6G1KG54_9PLEO|nr:glycoside hydrolase family 5 protein [Pleomassaria siparia CBS 279.74]